MNIEDIVAILDAAKKDAQCQDDISSYCDAEEASSDAHAGELDEQELDDMSVVFLEINRENKQEEETKDDTEDER